MNNLKAYGNVEVLHHTFLTSALGAVVFSFTPRPIYLRVKIFNYPLNMDWVGPSSVWRFWRREKRFPSAVN
jgi:hypothetical protein